jgi:hypothetical protein
MATAFSAWAHVQCHDTWPKKERFSSSGEGRWDRVSSKHERMTHQIRIATIIRPAFCRRQSDLEGEAAIPDLFLEHREGHLPPVVNVGDAGHQQFETVRLSVRTLQV